MYQTDFGMRPRDDDIPGNNNVYLWWRYLPSILTRRLIDYCKLYYARLPISTFTLSTLFLEIRCNTDTVMALLQQICVPKILFWKKGSKFETAEKWKSGDIPVLQWKNLFSVFKKFFFIRSIWKAWMLWWGRLFIELTARVYLLICKICSFEDLTRNSSAFARRVNFEILSASGSSFMIGLTLLAHVRASIGYDSLVYKSSLIRFSIRLSNPPS